MAVDLGWRTLLFSDDDNPMDKRDWLVDEPCEVCAWHLPFHHADCGRVLEVAEALEAN